MKTSLFVTALIVRLGLSTHTYTFFNTRKNWSDAKQGMLQHPCMCVFGFWFILLYFFWTACEDIGQQLAVIQTLQEQIAAADAIVPGFAQVWIGLKGIVPAPAGPTQYTTLVDGSPACFLNWDAPSPSGNGECGEIITGDASVGPHQYVNRNVTHSFSHFFNRDIVDPWHWVKSFKFWNVLFCFTARIGGMMIFVHFDNHIYVVQEVQFIQINVP